MIFRRDPFLLLATSIHLSGSLHQKVSYPYLRYHCRRRRQTPSWWPKKVIGCDWGGVFILLEERLEKEEKEEEDGRNGFHPPCLIPLSLLSRLSAIFSRVAQRFVFLERGLSFGVQFVLRTWLILHLSRRNVEDKSSDQMCAILDYYICVLASGHEIHGKWVK